MLQSLDKLRDKTLSFGCYVLMKDNDYDLCDGRIVRTHQGHEHVFLLDIGIIGEVDRTIGHPLTRGRLFYFRQNPDYEFDDDTGVFWKISTLFKENCDLYNQTEIEREKSEVRPELQKLLEEFALLIPDDNE